MNAKGFLRTEGDNVVGLLTDPFGYVTELRGVPVIQNGMAGYAMTARLIKVPDDLKIPHIDNGK